jgi:hypothetical protein
MKTILPFQATIFFLKFIFRIFPIAIRELVTEPNPRPSKKHRRQEEEERLKYSLSKRLGRFANQEGSGSRRLASTVRIGRRESNGGVWSNKVREGAHLSALAAYIPRAAVPLSLLLSQL